MEQADVLRERERIIEQIEKFVPAMRPLFFITKSLNEYSASLYDFVPKAEHIVRQQSIKDEIASKVKELFGPNGMSELNVDLDRPLALNIADHHQVLNHPFIISSNIIANTQKFLSDDKGKAIIVISSGNVPPNNYFSESGFRLHGKKVPIFSTAERESCSYYMALRDFDIVNRTKKADRWHKFTTLEQKFLVSLEGLLRGINYSQCKGYVDQITLIIRRTWPLMFEENMRATIPDLLYLTQEELTTRLLVKLLREDNIISRIILTNEYRQKVLDNFRGIVVTWRENEAKGTHFFWRRHPTDERTLRLYAAGNKLVPHDPRFKNLYVNIDRENIIGMLERRELSPSLFTIFSVLNFYSGIRPLVGYGSVQYLHLMKQAWLKTLTEIGENTEAELVTSVDTNGFVAGLAAFFKKENGKLQAQYAHDLMYDGGLRREYLTRLFAMKFHDVIGVGVADMYDYYSSNYVPENERINPRINFNDLAEFSFKWV